MLDGAMKNAPTLACRMLLPVQGGTGLRHRQRAQYNFTPALACDNFRSLAAYLRGCCPTAKPVVVRTGCLEDGTVGECARRPERFVIRLSEHLDEAMSIEVLCHEWAHAMAWNYNLDKLARTPGLDPAGFQIAAHDEAWGCAYSRVWRAYLTMNEAMSR